jgi:hypothetical protein
MLLVVVLLAGCGGPAETPAFKARFIKGGLDNDFGEFIDEHAGKKVKLDLQWAPGAEPDFGLFVLFETCAEPLEKGEAPSVGNCNGTEYNVPKVDGKTLLTEAGGAWRLRGEFTAGEKTGPLQGLFAVELEPAQ